MGGLAQPGVTRLIRSNQSSRGNFDNFQKHAAKLYICRARFRALHSAIVPCPRWERWLRVRRSVTAGI
jgi:hypothetical protein